MHLTRRTVLQRGAARFDLAQNPRREALLSEPEDAEESGMPKAAVDGVRWDAAGIFTIVLVGAFLALFGAARAIDAPFAAQMWTLLVAFVLAGAALTHDFAKWPRKDHTSRYENG